MRSGFIPVDKSVGLTSAAVVSRVKRALGAGKVGHAGTLDPFASGVLLCLVNSATRLASFAQAGEKVYSGVIRLGLETDTDDITGQALREDDLLPSAAAVAAAARQFVGEIDQIPPRYSAVKVAGQRSYRLARHGEQVELRARRVRIHEFELGAMAGHDIPFRMRCESGTYVRSVARDLGAALGCGACLAELRREYSAPFAVESAVALEKVSWEAVCDWRLLFPDTPEVMVALEEGRMLKAGDQRIVPQLVRRLEQQAGGEIPGSTMIYSCGQTGAALGLLRREQQQWRLVAHVC